MSAGGALERAPQAPERHSMADDVVHAAEGALGAVEVRENRLPLSLGRGGGKRAPRVHDDRDHDHGSAFRGRLTPPRHPPRPKP